MITAPNANTYSLNLQTPGLDPALLLYVNQASQTNLDLAFPNGSFTITADDYVENVSANGNINGDNYPNAPHVSNYGQAQVINPALDFTLRWDAFTSGSSSDVIQLVVNDANGYLVYQTAIAPGELTPRLDGTATAVTIPGYTLPPGQTFQATLTFQKITDTNSVNDSGGVPLIGYLAETKFPIATLTSAGLFPVAATGAKEYSISAAFDGTNYLSAILGNGGEIEAQLIAPSGLPAAPIMDTGHTGSAPLVAFDGNNYLMVWSSSDVVSTIRGQANKGNVAAAGSTVATGTNGTTGAPFIYGELISPCGSVGNISTLASGSSLQVRGLTIATNGCNLNYFIVYEDSSSGTNTVIYGEVVNTSGIQTSDPITIASGRNQKLPSVASDGTNFFVVWQSKETNTVEKWDVLGCFVNYRGTPGAPFIISQTNSPSYNPITVTFGLTNYVVAWSRDTGRGYPNPSFWDLSGRIVNPDGTFGGKEFALSTAAGDQVLPFSAFDGTTFLVDWLDVNSFTAPNNNAQIKGKFVTQAGGSSPEFALFQSFRGKIPVVAPLLFDGSRYFMEASYSSLAGLTNSFADSDVYATFLNVTVPAIITKPQNQFVAIGDTLSLSSVVSGQPPLQFQWAFNGTNIAGATDTSLRITNASAVNAGSYTITAQNLSGMAISGPGVITVLAKPLITAQPAGSSSAPIGQPYAFSVTATGGLPLQYQWRLNGTSIQGATDSTYTVAEVEFSNNGFYSVAVQNPVGAVNSTRAALLANGPSIAGNLADNFPGGTLDTDASGSGSGSNVGATSQPGEPIHGGHVGGSSVWFTWQAPADGIATFSTLGSSFDTLMAVYVGDSVTNLTRLVGDDDSAGFFASLVSFNATNGSTYHIAIDGRAGAQGNIVLTWSLSQVVADVPVITQSPSNQTATVGQQVTFTVVAQAPSALTYQWNFNDVPLDSATNSSLIFPSATTNLAGQYSVTVTSGSGQQRTSPEASLEINSSASTAPSEDKFADVLSGGPTLAAYKPHYTRNPKGQLVPVSAGALGTQLMNNFGATKEDGEPNHAGITGGSSRWFSLEALDTGTMVVDTIGSDFDTVLAVYTGTNLLTLKSIASDDNSAPDGIRSQVSFTTVAGTTYLVAVDGVNGVQGHIVLNWRLGNLPVFTQALTNQLVKSGTNLTLTVNATNNPASVPIYYQWQFNGVNIPGANGPSLPINNFQTGNSGSYRALASNYVGVTSTTGFLASGAPIVTVTAPANNFYTTGPTNLHISASSAGLDLTNLTFYQGTTKIGTRTNQPYSLIWSNAAAGVYSITARAYDKIGQIGTSAVVKVVIDTVKPTVTITAPVKGNRSTNPNVNVIGTVADNNGVASIICTFNGGAPQTVALTTNKWTNAVVCNPGTNVIVVQSVDLAGNLSVPATNSFFYVVSNAFTLVINGNGTVTKNFTGNMLELGRGYQLTAKPLNGFNVFSNWTGYVPASNNLVLNFIMSPGLVINANFVTNPFIPITGTYNGLYYETNQVKLTSAGMFTFTLASNGVFSGKLLSTNTTSLAISGQFDASGNALLSVPRTKQSNLVVNIQLDITNYSDIVSGSLTDPGWSAVMDGDRAVTNATAAGVSGSYTIDIPGVAGTNGPGGDSFATVVVKTNGTVTMTASLADGVTTAPISESTGIAKSGRWPFFASLYSGKGFMIGWNNLTNQGYPTVGDGGINWIKATNSPVSKFYPAGFTNDTETAGSIFFVTNKTRFMDVGDSAIVVLSGGNLPAPITNEFTWDTNNVTKLLTNNYPGTDKITLTITPAAGQFSGTFMHPTTKASVKISGALFQQQNIGAGFFPGTNQTGKVFISGSN